MSRRSLSEKRLFLFLSILFLDIYLFFGFHNGTIFTSSDSTSLFFASAAVINLFLVVPMFTKRDGASFYAILYVAIYLVALVVAVSDEITFLLIVPSAFAAILALTTLETKNRITKGVALTLVLLFMAVIGKVFTIAAQQVPGPLTIELLADRLTTIGLPVPITEYSGLFISTRYTDLITGPFQFLLFFFVSSLLVENYHRIIGLLARKRKSGLVSAGYGAISALGCQCESAIGIFPAATLLVFNFLLVPFFLLSALLLVLTYIMVVRYYEVQKVPRLPRLISVKNRGKMLSVELLVVVSQVLVLAGVFFHLQEVPIFLFGTAMAMILNGFLIYYIIHVFLPRFKIGPYAAVSFLVISVLIMLIWFIPRMTLSAVTSPVSFSLMSYSAVLSGFLISIVYFSAPSLIGSSFIEAYTVSLGLVPIAVYYLVFSIQGSLWNFWTTSQQAELSIVLWIAMLPFMWLSTQKSLISSFA